MNENVQYICYFFFSKVLTASHCVSSIAGQEYKWKIKMGAHNHRNYESSVQYRNVKRVIMHPSYNPRSLFADHALIEVDKPFQLNSRVTLACLPKDGYRIPHGTQSCYIAGNDIYLFVMLPKNIWY